MGEFDEYEIAFGDSRQLRVRRFQLTHVVLTDNREARESGKPRFAK
jgi:hypothetical protein